MSLKAKIEAVIYASEEPVTLNQLMGLLGEEAQAELEALATREPDLPFGGESAATPTSELQAEDADPGDPDALNAEAMGGPGMPVAEALDVEAEAVAEAVAAAGDRPVADGVETASPSHTPAEAEDKAAARSRERRLREFFRSLLDQLVADYSREDRGLEIREVAGGFRLATKPEYHDAVRGFVKQLKPPLKLSLQALETLAVVAYKQPVTAPEVSEIRGVDSGGVLGSLLARKLVTTAGRKQVIGRPILYKTTKDFLVRFGLKDINELPSIEEFEKMAGELADAEPVQEEIPMNAASKTADGQDSEGRSASGRSAPVSEINAAPEPTHMAHDTPADLMSDKSSAPEGHMREHSDPHEVEPMAGTHSAQADGVPYDERDRADELAEEEGHNPADDIVVDGRIGGLIPPSEQDQANFDQESPAHDAEVQSQAGEGE